MPTRTDAHLPIAYSASSATIAATAMSPDTLMSDNPITSLCFYTNPNHRSTFWGKYIYFYMAAGTISLFKGKIEYRSSKYNFDIDSSDITAVEVRSFGLMSNPFLKYIALTTKDGEFDFVPKRSFITPVWATCKMLKQLELNIKRMLV